uniref:Protein tyrosine phosphatase n=1 Tax=Monosiga ovata TaxID=81526 RepID=E5RKE8_9EUKA|nr:protein tyrosine phosphatase [Monosiga ovata]
MRPRVLDRRALVARDWPWLREEFAAMPTLLEEDAQACSKDRYCNILPNPSTRVALGGTKGGYINANHVVGSSPSRKYICTQGPMEHTVTDFWQMCWEQLTSVIVMVTELMDGRKEKCHRYWPARADTPMPCGPFTVTAKAPRVDGNIHVTELSLQHAGTSRTLHHFWYRGWPDFDVPDEADDNILKFVHRVRAAATPAPIVVHCSAGIGRTGTYIMIDDGMLQLRGPHRVVDIVSSVMALRRQRGGLIQMLQQYHFVHKALAEYLNMASPVSMYARAESLTISLKRTQSEFGLALRGSYPAFVSAVTAGSVADVAGLQVGDHLMKINGVDLTDSRHDDVIATIERAGASVTLVVLRPVPESSA